VLVDGLGGPWLTPSATIARERDWLRAVFDDPAATAPAPTGEVDPRFRHVVPRQTSLELARRGAGALPVPVLVLESPASLSGAHRQELVSSIPDVTAAEVADPYAATVAPQLVAWIRALDLGRPDLDPPTPLR